MAILEGSAIISSDIAAWAGPPLIGINLNLFFYGALVVQYYMYCIRYKDDKPWIKILVHFLFALESAQTAMSLADAFYWFACGFGHVDKLASFHFFHIDSPLMSSIIAFTSHGVYCWRIWCLTHCWKTCTAIILATFVQLTGGIGASIIGLQIQLLTAWTWKMKLFTTFWGIGSATADMVIALVLTIRLLKKKDESPYRLVENGVLVRIVRLCVETNSVTAFVAIIEVILIATPRFMPPHGNFFLCPGYILGKLYSNSFMTMLNNRDFVDRRDVFAQNTTTNVRWPAAPIVVDTVVSNDGDSEKARSEGV